MPDLLGFLEFHGLAHDSTGVLFKVLVGGPQDVQQHKGRWQILTMKMCSDPLQIYHRDGPGKLQEIHSASLAGSRDLHLLSVFYLFIGHEEIDIHSMMLARAIGWQGNHFLSYILRMFSFGSA